MNFRIALPLLLSCCFICPVGAEDVGQENVSRFAEDVLLHVVLHEMGHGLVREFDLPILGNEETLADAFATFYVTQYLPDRAFDVIKARTDSLMIEAREVPQAEWEVTGEHNNDARRAMQIAALAVAADKAKYSSIAAGLGMTERDINRAADYGAEIHRSWRRILRPVLMPDGMLSKEATMTFDQGCPLATQIRESSLATDIDAALKKFDWHSQVSVSFVEGDGGAFWSRSQRRINVRSDYVRRFIRQGQQAKK